MSILKRSLGLLLSLCLLAACLASAAALNAVAAAPAITINISQQEILLPDTVITATADASAVSFAVRLEGKTIGTASPFSFTPASQNLGSGAYTMVVEAKDRSGNASFRSVTFRVSDEADWPYTLAGSTVTASGNVIRSYDATPLPVDGRFGTTADGVMDLTSCNDMSALSEYRLTYGGEVTTSSVSGIPFQVFDIDLQGRTSGTVSVSYTGETRKGERVALKVYRPADASWDTLGTFTGSGSVSAQVEIAAYADHGVLHAAAMLDYVTNGSDTMVWITDPQYYAKYDDLHAYYTAVCEYAANEVTSGRAAYVLNTGDLIDEKPDGDAATRAAQWAVADQALAILDDAGVPNGVVTGNHDVGNFLKPNYNTANTSSNYTDYCHWFGASRYRATPWYGGSLNDNTSHYDLVTVGNTDLVILYLGYGFEATDETIAWANEVLTTYRHRTAIVATHAYLNNRTGDYNANSRAQLIFDRIVSPNANVCMVLCGHDDGSLCLERTAADGRTVYEILSDYQFIQAEDASFYGTPDDHVVGSITTACGDGYLRTMTFAGGAMRSHTYSPVTGRVNPYGGREDFSIQLASSPAARTLTTTRFSAAIVGSLVDTQSNTLTVGNGRLASVTRGGHTTYTPVIYTDIPAAPAAETEAAVDRQALRTLAQKASTIKKSSYTNASFAALQATIYQAQQAHDLSADTITIAYRALEKAIGSLQTASPRAATASDCLSLYKYDLSLSRWLDQDTGKSVSGDDGVIHGDALAGGGISLRQTVNNTDNHWSPYAYYDSSKTLVPVNGSGKLYLALDVDADSNWRIEVKITQGTLTKTITLNPTIEHFFYNLYVESFAGKLCGVFDVSDAFIKEGFDLTKSFTINQTRLYTLVDVRGNTTRATRYRRMEFLEPYFDYAALMPTKSTLTANTFQSGGLSGTVWPYWNADGSVTLYSTVNGTAWPSAYVRPNVAVNNTTGAYLYVKKDSSAAFNISIQFKDGEATRTVNLSALLGYGDHDLPAGEASYEVDLGAYFAQNGYDAVTISKVTYFVVGKQDQWVRLYDVTLLPKNENGIHQAVLQTSGITQTDKAGSYTYQNGVLTLSGDAGYAVTIPAETPFVPALTPYLSMAMQSDAPFNITLNLAAKNGDIAVQLRKEYFNLFGLTSTPSALPAGSHTLGKLSLQSLFPFYGGAVETSTLHSVTITLYERGTLTVNALALSSAGVAKTAEDGGFAAGRYPETALPDALTSSVVTIDGAIVRDVAAGTTVSALKAVFDQSSDFLAVYNADGMLLSDTALAGTGMTIVLLDGETVFCSYTLAVVGDVNGDGKRTSSDARIALQSNVSGGALSEAAVLAADLSGNKKVDTGDVRLMLRALV
ncbi:MAG: metallophosphoesterase [Clostridia bacterium]|nr:metallophosphoesterase [Clostridia bacterium]